MTKKVFFLFVLSIFLCSSVSAQTGNTQPNLNDQYTKKIGNLRFSVSTLSFGKVKTNEVKQDTIRIMNVGKSVMNISAPAKNDYSNITLSGNKLEAGESGWICVSYDFSKRDEYGFILDRILLNTNDADQPQKNVNVTATISEFFPVADSLSPKARIPETIYSYGSIKAGDKSSHDFTIYNDGSKPLFIRKVKSTCGCIKSSVAKSEIAPGSSGAIHIEFDSFGKEGSDSRIVNVFVNDPLMSEVKLEIKGIVLK